MAECYTAARLAALLPHPAADVHKYSRGRLVVVAGSAAYPGAACLAAFAAQRLGAGYVEAVCHPQSADVVRGYRPSLVVRPWDAWRADRALGELCAGKPCACVVGPGFEAAGARERQLVGDILHDARVPVLVDGGAISALATESGLALARRRAERGWPLVVTPHAGEAARLECAAGLGETAGGTRGAALARAFRCIVMLKGPDTFISDGTRTVAMCEGTPALAKAGTGDVLAGMVGALLAQATDPFDAAVLGAVLHARAGCAAAEALTDIAVTPEDVIDCIPQAIRSVDSTPAERRRK